MRSLFVAIPAVLGCFLPGCLPEPEPIGGQQLWRGRGVENLNYEEIDGALWTEFRIRRRLPMGARAGVYDIALMPNDGSQPARVVVPAVWDRPGAVVSLGGGEYWALRNETSVLRGAKPAQVGTLSHISLQQGILGEHAEVAAYGFGAGRSVLWLQRPDPMTGALVMHLIKDGVTRAFPDMRGPPTFLGKEILYTSGDMQTLVQLADFGAAPEVLHQGVSLIAVAPGSRFLILEVSRSNRRTHIVFDRETRMEVSELPARQYCCGLGFEGKSFIYAEGASEAQPARLHRFDVETGKHAVLDMPRGLVDVTRMVDRPRRAGDPDPAPLFRLIFDSKGRAAVQSDATGVSVLSLLPFQPLGGGFSPEGDFFIYVDNAGSFEPEGRLMVVDGAFATAPRVLSPVGTTLRTDNYFWMTDRGGTEMRDDDRVFVVFWSRFGRSSSDLYFGDPTSLQTTFVAEAIRDVSVTPVSVFGIMRTSQQDLVGDLVQRDLRTGEETLFARHVDSFIVGETPGPNPVERMTFHVRNRAPTDRDGIWVTTVR